MSPLRPLPTSIENGLPPTDNGASIVAEMRPSLLKYFQRRTGSRSEAEDLAQDVIVRALSHANWKSTAQAKGYIFRAAVNRWRDMRRRQRTRGIAVAWDEELSAEADAQGTPERVLIAREELNQLLRALADMSPRTRSVLILVKLERLRIAAVAGMLGISVSAVNKHLARGLASLARLREPQDGR